jgi:hypothetical protein
MSIVQTVPSRQIMDQTSKRLNRYNYYIVVLMLASAILGSTIFGTFQVICEIILFVLLINGVFHIKLNRLDILLLSTFLIISMFSLLRNSFIDFALNFKIYGLFVFTLVYFRKLYFYPRNLIRILHISNFILVFHQFITGHFVVESAWFFGDYKGYANDRPVGVFLVPHVSAFFIAVYVIYIIRVNKAYARSLFFLILLFMISSLTSTVALFVQLSQQVLDFLANKLNFLKINIGWSVKLVLIFVPILFLSIYSPELLEYLKAQGGYTRYYSLEILLNQFFDSRFFADIFDIVPRSYHTYLMQQEKIFADFGNEIGLVKVFVEGGFILGLVTLFALISRLKYYNMFIFVTFLHYSFVINMPFMLYLIMMYNFQIERYELEKKIELSNN